MLEVTRHKLVQAKGKEYVQPAEHHASSKPAAQLAPKSSLGTILSGVAERYKPHPSSKSSNGSDGEPSSTDSKFYSDQLSALEEQEYRRLVRAAMHFFIRKNGQLY